MSQKTDTMVKLALVFFISLLSFSIGTYVGKKYSDNQHKLALLEPKTEPTARSSTKHEEFASDATAETDTDKAHQAVDELMATNDAKPVALTDSEVAKIAEEFATEENTTEEKVVGTIDAEEKTLGTITPQAAAVEKIKQMATEERVPASLPVKKEVVTPLHFTVQVGSFPTQDEAEKLTQELQTKGYKTTFVPAKVNGQLWYRVNVGLFGTIKEAQDYKKEFLEKTKVSSAIIQRVQQ
jgi:cell division protein FtsN